MQYVRDGDELWVMTGHADGKRWWRNLRSPAPVEVLLRRRTTIGTGRAYTPAIDREVVAEGIRRYAARFPAMAKKLGVTSADHDAFERNLADTVILRIALDR